MAIPGAEHDRNSDTHSGPQTPWPDMEDSLPLRHRQPICYLGKGAGLHDRYRPKKKPAEAGLVMNGMVRDTGIEPVTPTVSRWCSTAELTARVSRTGPGEWVAPWGDATHFSEKFGSFPRGQKTPVNKRAGSRSSPPFETVNSTRTGRFTLGEGICSRIVNLRPSSQPSWRPFWQPSWPERLSWRTWQPS